MRIVERGHAARFAQKALLDRGIVRERIGQYLDRHIAIERPFVALVNHAHAAAAQFGDDIVMAQLLFHDALRSA